MANSKKKRMSGFARGMILYVVLFVMVAALGLLFFYSFIDNYEKTRPNRVMERFIDTLSDEQIERMSAGFISKLNADVCDMDGVKAFIADKAANASFAKSMAECTDTRTVYVLKDEDGAFGKVELTLGENVFFGLLANWQPTAGEIDLSGYLKELDLSVPPEYTVEFNGAVLGEKYIADDSVEYELLEEFYEDFDLPHMVKYHVDGYISDPVVTVRDGAGNTLDEAQLTEEHYLDNCTDEEKAKLDAFIEPYINAYVTYTSGANHLSGVNYHNLIPMVVPDSDLHFRIQQAIGGLGFASSRGDEIKAITVNKYCALGSGLYMCDVTYDVATIGQDGLHEYPNYTKILITESGGTLLAAAMASY